MTWVVSAVLLAQLLPAILKKFGLQGSVFGAQGLDRFGPGAMLLGAFERPEAREQTERKQPFGLWDGL